MDSRKREARIAGVLYLLLGVTAALEMSLPSVFVVHGDAAATVGKIASSQLLYRLYAVSGLVSQILFVFLVMALHQLLKGVNRRQAALMVHWFSCRCRWRSPIRSAGSHHSYCRMGPITGRPSTNISSMP